MSCSSVITTVEPERDFDLAHGSSAQIAGSSVTITFDSVPEDSRCPSDVQCVWEGNATLHFTADSAGTPRHVELRTAGVRQPVDVFGFRLELRDVRPVPTSDTALRQEQYVATLRVSGSGT